MILIKLIGIYQLWINQLTNILDLSEAENKAQDKQIYGYTVLILGPICIIYLWCLYAKLNWFFDIRKSSHFLISENWFSDVRNAWWFSDIEICKIFWYQKMIFWYQKIIRNFWYQQIIFPKIIFDKNRWYTCAAISKQSWFYISNSHIFSYHKLFVFFISENLH